MAVSQETLYRELGSVDPELSWSEQELPERERTKHVHRLHPYLGKFVPQLVEVLLDRYVPRRRARPRPVRRIGDDARPGARAGLRRDGRRRGGLQLPADAREDAPPQPRRAPPRPAVGARAGRGVRAEGRTPAGAPRYVREWYAPRPPRSSFTTARSSSRSARRTCLRVILARSARSARLTTHFDLDFPAAPQRGEYWCHKHKRTCRPVESARRFLLRYTLDTLDRDRDVRGGAAARCASPRCSTATRASSSSARPSTASSRRRRTRG